MTAILLTGHNLAFLKHNARRGHPHALSSHISEALAYGLGQHTHAAFLAHMNEVGAAHLVVFNRNRFTERLNQLGLPLESRWQCPPSSQFPKPIWREFKDGDKAKKNSWFYECQQNGIPFLSVIHRRKYARFEWDCVSLDPRHDKAIDGENRTLIATMFKRFQILAEPRKAIFDGSAFVGEIDPLTPKAAFKIADEMFALLYSAIGMGQNNRADSTDVESDH